MIEEYIKHNQAEEAVNFVNSINWNADGNNCFVCLSAVMNYLLKFPLTGEREGVMIFFNGNKESKTMNQLDLQNERIQILMLPSMN